VRLDGNNAKAHYRKAQALESMGKLAESEEAYQAGLSLLPESQQLKNGLSSVRERLRASKNVEADALAKIKEIAKEKDVRDKAMAEEEEKKASLAAEAKTAAAAAAAVAGHGGASGGADAAGRSVPVSGAALKRQIKNLGKDSAKLWGYLGKICGDSVGKLLVSGLEEEELMPIVKALEEHGVASDAKQSWQVIKSVASVPRVGITCKMLDRRDSAKLETLLLKLHPAKASAAGHTVEEYAAVRKSLGV
jgi:tetratricopeptide (TPR) repeat protein